MAISASDQGGGGGGLTAPTNPGEDNRIAYASAGDLAYAASVKTDGSYLQIGATNPATAGDARVSHGFAMRGRNSANSANVAVFRWGAATNRAEFGEDSANIAGITFSGGSSSTFQFNLGGTTQAQMSNNVLQIGRASNAYTFKFKSDVTSATFEMEARGSGAGVDLDIKGQNNNDAAAAAGDINLHGGVNSGAGADGVVAIYGDGALLFTAQNLAGAAHFTISKDVNDPIISMAARTTAGDCAKLTILGQNADDGKGGDLFLEAGDAAGTNKNGGAIEVNSGTETGSGTSTIKFRAGGAGLLLELASNGSTAQLGFFNTATAGKQTVTGIRDSNAALANLLTALATYGLIVDSTTAT